MDIQLFAVFLSLSVSLIVLFFIIWDHLKDDRILARQVQEFYGDIEMLIFTHVQVNYYNAIQANEAILEDEDLSLVKKSKNRDIIQNSYLKMKINQNFPLYSQYLGLTFNKEKKIYLNGTIYILHENGNLIKRNIDLYSEENIIPSFIDIKKEEILEILNFLNSLRFYWKKRYKKILFRPELVQLVNFYDLLGYIKPIEKKKKKGRVRLYLKKEKI